MKLLFSKIQRRHALSKYVYTLHNAGAIFTLCKVSFSESTKNNVCSIYINMLNVASTYSSLRSVNFLYACIYSALVFSILNLLCISTYLYFAYIYLFHSYILLYSALHPLYSTSGFSYSAICFLFSVYTLLTRNPKYLSLYIGIHIFCYIYVKIGMLYILVKNLHIFTYFYVFIIPSYFLKCLGFPETYFYE